MDCGKLTGQVAMGLSPGQPRAGFEPLAYGPVYLPTACNIGRHGLTDDDVNIRPILAGFNLCPGLIDNINIDAGASASNA